MENKNTIIMVLLIVIIVILGYVAFVKPKNVNDNYQPQKNQNNITNIPKTNIDSNTITDQPNDPQNYQSFKIISKSTITDDPHILSVIESAQSQSANFAGHYVVITAGCGTQCGYPVLYDKNTGKLYDFDRKMLSGSLNEDGSEPADVGWFQTSVSSDIISFKKKAVDGSIYLNQWKLVGELFMEVQ